MSIFNRYNSCIIIIVIKFRNTDEYDMLIKATNDYIRKGVEYLTSFLDTTFSKSNLMDHFESEEKTFKKHIEELKDQALFDLIDAVGCLFIFIFKISQQ